MKIVTADDIRRIAETGETFDIEFKGEVRNGDLDKFGERKGAWYEPRA